jgi:hypothetical protein
MWGQRRINLGGFLVSIHETALLLQKSIRPMVPHVALRRACESGLGREPSHFFLHDEMSNLVTSQTFQASLVRYVSKSVLQV